MPIQAQTNSPEEVRLVFAEKKGNICEVNTQECYVVGPVTFEANGDITNITCFDSEKNKDVVIARLKSGATENVTFDLSRHLPKAKMSKLYELIRRNCDISIYLLRSTECADLSDALDFGVMSNFGTISDWGNYTTTDMRTRSKNDGAALIEESTTVSCTVYREIGQQVLATRGGATTAPIVSIANCDKESCGGDCAEDSDGCQLWMALQRDLIIHLSEDLYDTTTVLPAIVSTLTNPVATKVLCVGKRVIVLALGDLNTGAVYHTTKADVLTGTPTWTEITQDVDATALVNLNDAVASNNYAWLVGSGGVIYQFDSVRGTVTPIVGVPGVTADFNSIDLFGDTIIIGGNSATVLRSSNGGSSFQTITVIDPATGLALAGSVNLTAVGILSDTNWTLGTSDTRTLFTFNNGTDWQDQLIEATAGTGSINALSFTQDDTRIGYVVLTEAAVGRQLQAFYGNCEQWVDMPTDADPLPANIGLNDIKVCPSNPNVTVSGGEVAGGTGIILVGAVELA
jgi:hypothetical protein